MSNFFFDYDYYERCVKKYFLGKHNQILNGGFVIVCITLAVGVVCGNIFLKFPLSFIPVWLMIAAFLEGLYEGHIMRKVDKLKKEEETQKKLEKEARERARIEKEAKSYNFTYDKMLDFVKLYSDKEYPENVKMVVENFLAQLTEFCNNIIANEVNPELYRTFFDNHLVQIFGILTNDDSKNNISENQELVEELIKNLSLYIERESNKILSGRNMDEIATLQAFSNFYYQGEEFKRG